ncbi:MAG: hypothetical protein JXB06_14910 [Spirochaetales bacterium]|nr:hypothetical protein [Spirochaetales bacterium]
MFGSLGQTLPSFTHAYSFTVILIVVLGLRIRSIVGASVGWLFIETLFEIGQHPAVCRWFAASTAGRVESSRFLSMVLHYFCTGVFDPLDVAASVLGAGLGAATVLIFKQGATVWKR